MNITNYLIEANLGLIFFSAVYFLLLHRETQFKVKRAYLLGAMLASVVFPLIEFQRAQPVIPSISTFVPVYYLPEVGLNEITHSAAPVIDYWNVAGSIYSMVVGILLILFCIRIGKLVRYLKSSSFAQEGKFKIVESTFNHPTFSFFHYIFIGNAQELDEREKQQIVNHEKLHASHIHSLDLLACEVFKIFFWFNPVVYILKNELVSIHEFEADQQAVQHQDANQYCELLARGSLASAGFTLTNHFHNSLTLKRIVMINTEKTRIRKWKYVMLIPVFSAAFLMASGQDQLKFIKLQDEIYTTVDQPATPKNGEDVAKFIQKNIKYPAEARKMKEQGKVSVAMVIEKDGTITNLSIVQSISPSLDAEALRIAGMLAPWNPGTNRGEAVRMKMILPLEFKLDGIEQAKRPVTETEGVRMQEVSIVGYTY